MQLKKLLSLGELEAAGILSSIPRLDVLSKDHQINFVEVTKISTKIIVTHDKITEKFLMKILWKMIKMIFVLQVNFTFGLEIDTFKIFDDEDSLEN